MRDVLQVNNAVDKHGDAVRRVCFLYLKNGSDAEDVFQEVFLKYMLHTAPFRDEEHEKAWLLRVSINQCKDLLRRFRRRASVPLEEADGLEQPLPEQHRDVYQAVLTLPEKYKSAVYLHYYEGYTAQEIASLLNKPENTVYTWLSRARKLLRNILEEEEGGIDG